jgi:hypothetical protein
MPLALAQSNADTTPTPAPSTGSSTPFIDSLKQKMRESGHSDQVTPRSDENPEPYIDTLKKRLKESGTPQPSADNTQPFIDQLKSKNPSLNNPPPGQDYTQQKLQALPPKETGGAIAAVNEGRSALEMKRPLVVKNVFGMKTGTLYKHSATASSDTEATAFQTVYGSGYAPDVKLYGEHDFLASETGFNFGVMVQAGIQYFAGPGVFSIRLTAPDGSSFGTQSHTRFAFVNLPAGIGPSIRLNYLKWIHPYAQFLPTASAFFESRNDSNPGYHGLALGFTFTAGAAFALDWLSKEATWALYRDYRIKHVYLTADYTVYSTPLSDVNFSFSGLDLGFAFDF